MANGDLKYVPVLVPICLDGAWVASYWHYLPVPTTGNPT